MKNYRIYNNDIDQKDFRREFNPLNLKVAKDTYNVKAYNKIPNKINTLLGEEYKRALKYKAVLINPDGVKEKDELMSQKLKQEGSQSLANLISRLRQIYLTANSQAAAKSQAEEMIEEMTKSLQAKFEKYSPKSFLSSKEQTANSILSYLIVQQDIKDKMNDGFKHGLIAGDEYVWVGVENGQPSTRVLNSAGVFFHRSPEVKWVQDSLYAGYRSMMAASDILDRYSDFLTPEDVSKLEGPTNGLTHYGAAPEHRPQKKMVYHHNNYEHHHSNTNQHGSYGIPHLNSQQYLVTHVEWRSQQKVGFITTTNEYGDKEIIRVSEDFKLPTGSTKLPSSPQYPARTTYQFPTKETFYWAWIPQIWEGVRIGYDIYTCIRPKPYQYYDPDNPHYAPLGYHGLIYSAMNANPISLQDRMYPFQELLFIAVEKLKQLIAHDKPRSYAIDTTMIPKELGIEKTMYYLENMGYEFFNPLQNAELPGAYQRGKVTNTMDRSTMQHVASYIQLIEAIDQQISDVAGIPKAKEGQIQANEAVTNTQQSIMSSSLVTEATYFSPHFKLWEKVFSQLVHIAQQCWKHKGINKQYVLSSGELATIKISPNELPLGSFGVFIQSAGKEVESLTMLKSWTQALIQNDKASLLDALSILREDSLEQAEQKLRQSQKDAELRQAQQQKQAQQLQQQALEAAKEEREDKQAHEVNLAKIKGGFDLQKETIRAMSWGGDADQNGVPDVLEMAKWQSENSRKSKELDHKIDTDKEKLKLEKEKLKVARINKSKK